MTPSLGFDLFKIVFEVALLGVFAYASRNGATISRNVQRIGTTVTRIGAEVAGLMGRQTEDRQRVDRIEERQADIHARLCVLENAREVDATAAH